MNRLGTIEGGYSILRFNLIFWSFYFLYQWLGLGGAKDQYYVYFQRAIWTVPVAILVAYLSIHYLFNKFYFKNRTAFWVGQFVLAVVFVGVLRSVNYYCFYPVYYPEGRLKPLVFLPKIIVEFVNLYLIVSLYGLFIFMRSWYKQQQAFQEVKKEKVAAELELLKSQVQPHFIFNMLNNIYSISLKKAPRRQSRF